MKWKLEINQYYTTSLTRNIKKQHINLQYVWTSIESVWKNLGQGATNSRGDSWGFLLPLPEGHDLYEEGEVPSGRQHRHLRPLPRLHNLHQEKEKLVTPILRYVLICDDLPV